MATKLFLRNTQNNGIGATYYDMVTAAGAASDTAVVNSAASGTEIQWTKTAGGAVIQFISGRVPAGGFTLTSTDISIWAHESNAQANCGGRFRVFKRAANGTETELGGGPFNDGVEFGTSAAEMLWVGNVTDTAFAENDRILLKLYITNVGTMGSGRTCTLTFNAANAATGDSFFNIAETVAFKSEEVTGSGALTAASPSSSGSGLSTSTGTGSPTAAASSASGAGISTSTGTGELTAASSAVNGEGEASNPAITGEGALAAATASATGEGLSSSAGTGALTSQAPAIGGEGISASSGSGAAAAQSPSVAGAGVSASTGTGSPAASSASISGSQASTVEGEGAIASDAATVTGAGLSTATGTGALVPSLPAVFGVGVTLSFGTGALSVGAAGVSGEGIAEGAACNLIAGAATVSGIGIIQGPAQRRARMLRGIGRTNVFSQYPKRKKDVSLRRPRITK